MPHTFHIGQTVKFKYPQPGEENLRFTITAIHEADGKTGEKLHLQEVTNDYLKATFCHFSTDYEPLNPSTTKPLNP